MMYSSNALTSLVGYFGYSAYSGLNAFQITGDNILFDLGIKRFGVQNLKGEFVNNIAVQDAFGGAAGLAIMGLEARFLSNITTTSVGIIDDISINSNPFKGKTFSQIDEMFRNKGFTVKGKDSISGKGSYINPKSGTKYYLDKGGIYRIGLEKPHVDVFYNNHPSLEKVRFFLDGGKSWKIK